MSLLKIQVVEIFSDSEKLKAAAMEESAFNDATKDVHSKRYRYFGAYNNNKLVGMARIDTCPIESFKNDVMYEKIKKMNPEIEICCLVISLEYQRKGIARKIREKLQESFSSIITHISHLYSNVSAMEKLNSQMGFKRVFERLGGRNVDYFWAKQE